MGVRCPPRSAGRRSRWSWALRAWRSGCSCWATSTGSAAPARGVVLDGLVARVVLADRLLWRRRDPLDLCTDRRHVNPAGPVAMLLGLVGSVALFGNQA